MKFYEHGIKWNLKSDKQGKERAYNFRTQKGN